jgi:cell division protein FtsW
MLTFVPGVAVEKKGSARWIDLGFINFQPSELVKLATIILISKLTIDYLQKGEKRDLKLAFAVLIASSGAVLLQKDMTTASIIFVSGFTPLFISRIRLRELAPLIGIAMSGAVVGVLVEKYRLMRLLVFLDPWKAGEAGHQVVVSLRALSEGGIKGVGLGMSNLKYNVLPEAYTDFIFAVLGSELGLLGSLITLILILLFFIFGFRLSSKMKDTFSKLVSYSIITLFSVQSIINVGGAVQLLPPTGVPLPFISYGGTFLVVSFISLGIIFGLLRWSDEQSEYSGRGRRNFRPRISTEKDY